MVPEQEKNPAGSPRSADATLCHTMRGQHRLCLFPSRRRDYRDFCLRGRSAVFSRFARWFHGSAVVVSFVPTTCTGTGTSTTEHVASLLLPIIPSIHGKMVASDGECSDLFPFAPNEQRVWSFVLSRIVDWCEIVPRRNWKKPPASASCTGNDGVGGHCGCDSSQCGRDSRR